MLLGYFINDPLLFKSKFRHQQHLMHNSGVAKYRIPLLLLDFNNQAHM